MLKLAIDGNEANTSNRVGSNVYAFEVIKALYSLKEVRLAMEVTVVLSDAPVADLPAERKGWKYLVLKPTKLWTQFALPLHLWLHPKSYDVFYTPGHYAPRWCGVPYISSVMDLAFYEYPEQFKRSDLLKLRRWTEYSVRSATKVVAISKATKESIQHYLRRTDKDIVLGYPALPELAPVMSLSDGKVFEKKLQLTKPYFVYVGTLQPRKNVLRLIHAFELLVSELALDKRVKVQPQLILAGKIGWLADEIVAAVNESSVKTQIKLVGYVTEAEKLYLLQHAVASVLVGLYEGFGIPPLESIRVGTIPIVSNTTSLPEVVGKAGILVNPLDEKKIAAGLRRALELSSRERAQLRKNGRDQLRKFSWTETAKTIVATIHTCLDS